MSSVLKALQKQSSPLLPRQTQVAFSEPAVESKPIFRLKRGTVAGLLVVVVIGIGLGWFSMSWTSVEPTIPQTLVTQPTTSITLGSATVIKTPTWPEPTDTTSVANGTAIEPNRTMISTGQGTTVPTAVDLEQVSPELLASFEQAVAASSTGTNDGVTSVVPELTSLELSFQRLIPSFSYDGHQYSSRAQASWIVLAGRRLQEGDQWQGIQVVSISPQHVVLAHANRAFLQPALEDWTNPL